MRYLPVLIDNSKKITFYWFREMFNCFISNISLTRSNLSCIQDKIGTRSTDKYSSTESSSLLEGEWKSSLSSVEVGDHDALHLEDGLCDTDQEPLDHLEEPRHHFERLDSNWLLLDATEIGKTISSDQLYLLGEQPRWDELQHIGRMRTVTISRQTNTRRPTGARMEGVYRCF